MLSPPIMLVQRPAHTSRRLEEALPVTDQVSPRAVQTAVSDIQASRWLTSNERKIVAPEAIFLLGMQDQRLSEPELQEWTQRIYDKEDSVVVTKDILMARARQDMHIQREKRSEYEVQLERIEHGKVVETVRGDSRRQTDVQELLATNEQWQAQAQEHNAQVAAVRQQQLDESYRQVQAAVKSVPSQWEDVRLLTAEATQQPVQMDATSLLEMMTGS